MRFMPNVFPRVWSFDTDSEFAVSDQTIHFFVSRSSQPGLTAKFFVIFLVGADYYPEESLKRVKRFSTFFTVSTHGNHLSPQHQFGQYTPPRHPFGQQHSPFYNPVGVSNTFAALFPQYGQQFSVQPRPDPIPASETSCLTTYNSQGRCLPQSTSCPDTGDGGYLSYMARRPRNCHYYDRMGTRVRTC